MVQHIRGAKFGGMVGWCFFLADLESLGVALRYIFLFSPISSPHTRNQPHPKTLPDMIRELKDIKYYAKHLLTRRSGKGVFGFGKCFLSPLSQRKDNRVVKKQREDSEEKSITFSGAEKWQPLTTTSGIENWLPLTTTCGTETNENFSGTEKWHPLTTSYGGKAENRVNELVGANESIKCLVSFLKEDNNGCPFLAVYGKGGLGKTALVQKAYNSSEVRHKFMGCAWITAPHQVQAKTLWQDILSQIHPQRKDEFKQLSDLDLVQSLQSSLQSKKYLVVLDDVCSTEALLMAMPAGKMRSKVVITTRNKNEAEKIVEKRGQFLEMRELTDPQSWELFLRTQLPCHISEFEKNLELKGICRGVVKKCHGVPLVIKMLGDLMAEKHSIEQWKLLQQQESMSAQDISEFSYNNLPDHLKTCLLYLALFPKGTDIEAETLYNLWIAEEMITSQGDGNSTMLSTAETYLKDLATVGLVQVHEERTPTTTSTKIKSCRVSDFVRDLCSRKRKERKFATVHLRAAHNLETHTPSSSDDVRALAFYFDKGVGKYDFPLKPETYGQVRSFLFLNTHEMDGHYLLFPKSLVLKNFKLLRVLDFNWLYFHAMKLPKDIEKLSTLRYLSFKNCYLQELPPSIGKLANLEILDLRVNPMVDMSISNILCKLKRLRNLFLPYKFHAIGDQKLQLDGLSKLENLKNFVSRHCRASDLSSLENLKCLAATIDGNIEDLEVTIKCINEGRFKLTFIDLKNFDCYSQSRRSALRNLLGCGYLNTLHVEGHIGKLSDKLSSPNCAKLTEIFLIGSELTEDPMPVLGNFPKLKKLGICNGAFLGDQMVCKEEGFPHLRYLKLSNLHNLKIWSLGERAMLNLCTLAIERCQSLPTLPNGLSNLQQLSFVKMPKIFTLKYESQGEDFSKIQHVPIIKIL